MNRRSAITNPYFGDGNVITRCCIQDLTRTATRPLDSRWICMIKFSGRLLSAIRPQPCWPVFRWTSRPIHLATTKVSMSVNRSEIEIRMAKVPGERSLLTTSRNNSLFLGYLMLCHKERHFLNYFLPVKVEARKSSISTAICITVSL